MSWWPFSATYKIKCPQGHFAIVYRDIDKALPLYIKNNDLSANLKAKAAELGDVELSAASKSIVSDLLYAIDQRNSSQIMDFRNAYLSFLSDPCGKSEFLARIVTRIMEGRENLEQKTIQAQTFLSAIKSAPENASELISAYFPLLKSLGVAGPQIARDEIVKAKSTAKKVLEQSHE